MARMREKVTTHPQLQGFLRKEKGEIEASKESMETNFRVSPFGDIIPTEKSKVFRLLKAARSRNVLP